MVLQNCRGMLMGNSPSLGLSKSNRKDSTAILAAIQLVRKIREVDAFRSFIFKINFRDQNPGAGAG